MNGQVYYRACRVAAAVAALVSHASAQRWIDLTGKPIAVLGEHFSGIGNVRELDGARVLAIDPVERAVILADFTRESTQRVGRDGSGPGEYRYPGAIVASADGATWLYDPPLARISRISSAGAIDSRMYPAPENVLTLRGADRTGRLYFEGNEYDPSTGGFSRTVPIVRSIPERAMHDIVARVATGGRVVLQRPSGPMSMARSISPYPRMDAWVPLPDGRIAIVRADTFRVDVVGNDGRITRGPLLPNTPIVIGAAERSAFRESQSTRRMSATSKGGSNGPAMPAFEWRDEDFPKTLPPFRYDAVLASPEGEVWIARSAAAGARTHSYDVISADGRVVATATLDVHSNIVGFGSGVIYIARTDPDDGLVRLEKRAR